MVANFLKGANSLQEMNSYAMELAGTLSLSFGSGDNGAGCWKLLAVNVAENRIDFLKES